MEIIVAKSAGFCFGVQNAVDIALQTQGKTVTLGEIIHNKYVVEQLANKNIFPIDSLDEYVDGKVIIRSHGVGKNTIDYLKSNNIEYIDATCPFVLRIHDIVSKHFLEGYQIIIIGEKDHPEVIGTNGWCNDSAIVISTLKECENLKILDKKCCVVCQTTFSYENYKKIIETVKNNIKTLEIFDTICYTTKVRQEEAVVLAKKCDYMFVIGGLNSSNTRKLFELCKINCENTFHIENADSLPIIANKNVRLGITAGASTPQELIMEVVKQMSEIQNEVNEFEAAMAAQKDVKIKAGQKQKVTVISADETGVKVSFGGKTDAFIDKAEVEIDEETYDANNYPTGMTFVAEFIEKKAKADMVAMSKKRMAIREKEMKEAEEIIKGSDFTVKIDKSVKGGLLAKFGPYTIFIPQSQIKIGFESDLEKHVGKEIKVRMIPAKKDEEDANEDKKMGRRIVASHRVIVEEDKKIKEDAFWSVMVPETIVKGKVKRFTAFGAFVSVNGNDCLAHISDLSWVKVNDPSEVLEINKTYNFVVLNASRETGKVSLGYKQLQKKPYEEAVEKYPVGSVVTGKVERIFNYGAFISIDRGVDGLIPVSEISYSYIKDANDAFTVGQEITAQVIKFEANRITLSVKATLPVPEVKEVEITEDDMKEANEKRNKANAKKFDNIPQSNTGKKRATKRVSPSEEKDEAKNWTSETSGATFADLFKGLDFSSVTDNDSDNE